MMDAPSEQWNGEGVPPQYRLSDRQRQKYRGARPWDRWYILQFDKGVLKQIGNGTPKPKLNDLRVAIQRDFSRFDNVPRSFYGWDPHVMLTDLLHSVEFLRADPSKADVIRLLMNNTTTRELQNRALWVGYMCTVYLERMVQRANQFNSLLLKTALQKLKVAMDHVALVTFLHTPRPFDSVRSLQTWLSEVVFLMRAVERALSA